nr:photosystem I P700 apoprotein A2, chloroplastic [Tanacetum cinerariifolium]
MGTLKRLYGIKDRGSSLGSSHSRWCSSGQGELPELFLMGWTMSGAKTHLDRCSRQSTLFVEVLIYSCFTETDPLRVRPITHAICDPHFGQPAVEAFTQGGALGPVNIAYSGVYQWWYTIGLRTNKDLYTGALFLLFISTISLIAGWLHLQLKWKPSVSWFKNAESRLNHHLSGLFGVSSLAWTGHLVHVTIPASRGEYVQWNNFLDVLPHPQGLGLLFTGQWNLYAQNPNSSSHLFGTSQGAGTAILTLLGGFHPQTQSLWLTDMAHHHLAIAFIFLIAGH